MFTKINSQSTKIRDFSVQILFLFASMLLLASGVISAQPPTNPINVIVYKSPTCGCCKSWVDHMKENGFKVEVHDQYNVNPIKEKLGVARNLQSCHTAKVGGYVIEGHVPASDIKRLLKEKPKVTGLAAPGMPMGSPGMEGPRKDPYDVLTFQRNGKTTVFASHNQK